MGSYRLFHNNPCNLRDEGDFCKGHTITRQEFIDIYCGGIEPPQLKPLDFSGRLECK